MRFLGLTLFLDEQGELQLADDLGNCADVGTVLACGPEFLKKFYFVEKYTGERRWDWEVNTHSFLYRYIAKDKAWLTWIIRR